MPTLPRPGIDAVPAPVPTADGTDHVVVWMRWGPLMHEFLLRGQLTSKKSTASESSDFNPSSPKLSYLFHLTFRYTCFFALTLNRLYDCI